MVIKTITITENAYESIKRLKHEGESFSKLFLRLSEKKLKVKDLAGAIKMSDKEAAKLRKHIRENRKKISKDLEERRARIRHLCSD